MKKLLYIALVASMATSGYAQMHKKSYPFPATGEYQVLKADFHQHTVFSDGEVWPSTRVKEAWEEDLDVIALTEHIEYRRHVDDMILNNHNRSWEIARETAKQYDILLIQSAEITRAMPPGHLNVIGIKDANAFDKYWNKENHSDSTGVYAALSEAKRQGAFIIWNHTAYPTKDNKSTWHPKHEELKNAGLINGLEIVNGERYESTAFGWCLQHNLTIFSNTDVHSTMAQKRNADNSKVLTLVLAKDKSFESVMDALRDHRTAAIWNNQLMGREEHVAAIVKPALSFDLKMADDKNGLLEITNKCGLPLTFVATVDKEVINFRTDVPIVVPAQEIVAMGTGLRKAVKSATVKVRFTNVLTSPTEYLEVEYPINIK